MAATAGCGESGAASVSAPTVSNSGTSGAGGSTSGTSGSPPPPPPPSQQQHVSMLFEQPALSGIAGHLYQPRATQIGPPEGAFALLLWQRNKYQANGQLVATGWDAGSLTGFTPAVVAGSQLGFQNLQGTSTAQIESDAVGAYINSRDLPQSTADQKMMITPQYIFPPGSQPVPFASAQTTLGGALDLQVPTAAGPNTYVVEDLLFQDGNGTRLSIGIKLFRNGGSDSTIGIGYDSPTGTFMLNSPLGMNQRFVTLAAGSASAVGSTWSGWRHFEWSMSDAQFASALQYLAAQYPNQVKSLQPSQYVLTQVHLNAEFHTQGKTAELGWSMRGMQLWNSP
jgi:hypothetical protein